MNYNNYGMPGVGMNTMGNIGLQQQRLAQLEQQYPQVVMPQYGQMPQPQMMQMPQQQGYLKGRAVTGYDEAKASMIDLDGSIHIFTDIGNKKIYTKQINLDGTAALNVYTLVEQNESQDSSPKQTESIDYVKRDELESISISLSSRISQLERQLLEANERLVATTRKESVVEDKGSRSDKSLSSIILSGGDK